MYHSSVPSLVTIGHGWAGSWSGRGGDHWGYTVWVGGHESQGRCWDCWVVWGCIQSVWGMHSWWYRCHHFSAWIWQPMFCLCICSCSDGFLWKALWGCQSHRYPLVHNVHWYGMAGRFWWQVGCLVLLAHQVWCVLWFHGWWLDQQWHYLGSV